MLKVSVILWTAAGLKQDSDLLWFLHCHVAFAICDVAHCDWLHKSLDLDQVDEQSMSHISNFDNAKKF